MIAGLRRHLAAAAVLVAAGGVGCAGDNKETTWVQFNAEDQTLVVDVLPLDSAPGEPIELVLLSNLRRTEVGVAAITPGSGPVRTEHEVTVDIYDGSVGEEGSNWADVVGRVTVIIDSEAVEDLDDDGDLDSRGEGEFELAQDSANPGAWARTFQSLGANDERRSDSFTIVLWQPEELGTATDTTEQ